MCIKGAVAQLCYSPFEELKKKMELHILSWYNLLHGGRGKMKKVNKLLLTLVCIVFISILGYEYSLSYNFRTQPPSQEWAKGTQISKGSVKNYPKLVKLGGNYIVVHDDGDKIKALIVDNLGKVLKEKTYPAGDNLILNLNMLNDGENVYINWITINKGTKYLNNIKLNKDIELQDKWTIEGVNESVQLDDVTMAVLLKDKIEVYNIKDDTKVYKDVVSPTLLAGSKTNRGYIITYWEDQQAFKYFFVKDGIASSAVTAVDVTVSRNVTFTKATVECDDKTGYMIIESKTSDEYGIPKFITFDLDKGNGKSNRLKIDYYGDFAYNPVGVSSGDEGARFLISYERYYGLRDIQNDIIDITYKDGEMVKRSYLTNAGNPMMYPGIYGNTALYCEYIGDKNLNVYMTSTEEAFKAKHNDIRGYEKKKAAADTILGTANTFVGVLTVGIRWIVVAAVLISLLGLFSYKLKDKSTKVSFSIIYFIVTILKLLVIYDMFYKAPMYNLPWFYSTTTMGLLFCIGISILCFLYGYTRYIVKRGSGSYPHVMSLVIALTMDSIITQLLFIPFMP